MFKFVEVAGIHKYDGQDDSSTSRESLSCSALPQTDLPRPSIAVSGTSTGRLSLYQIHQEEGFSLKSVLQFDSPITDVSFSGDALKLSVCFENSMMKLVDTSTLSIIETMKYDSDSGAVTCSAFSTQSNVLAVGSQEGSIQMHDVRPPRRIIRRLFPAHSSPVTSISSHPDGSVFLSTGLDGLARIWDVAGPCLATLMDSSSDNNGGLSSGIFSPNGRYALLGAMQGEGCLSLWDLSHSGRLKRVRKYARSNSKYWMKAAFTTDLGKIVGGTEEGKLLAWGDSTNVIAEYDLKTSKGINVPISCSTSKSYVICGGIGAPNPSIFQLVAVES